MKKFVTLALALIMALSLAAPALAFTGVEVGPEAANDIKLSIKLVDVSQGIVTGSFNAPPANRGYAKNEVICAVASMEVPAGKTPAGDFDTLVFSGKNVTLWQDENFRAASYGDTAASGTLNAATADGGGVGMLQHVSNNFAGLVNAAKAKATTAPGDVDGYGPFSYAANMGVDNEIILEFAIGYKANGAAIASPVPIFPASPSSNAVYQFAIFGKVISDDASMSATLKGKGALLNASDAGTTDNPTTANTASFNLVAIKNVYMAGYFNPNIKKLDNTAVGTRLPVENHVAAASSGIKIGVGPTDIVYVVTDVPTGNHSTAVAKFAIVTDKNFKTKAMYVYTDAVAAGYRVQQVDASAQNATKARFWDDISLQFVDLDTAAVEDDLSDIAFMMKTLEDVVAGDFGLDIRLVGSYMKPEWWAGNKTLSAEVVVEPWYAEVTVPPEIEIEIPKTGDALSVMGFVLIALAGLAVVAVRKVRA